MIQGPCRPLLGFPPDASDSSVRADAAGRCCPGEFVNAGIILLHPTKGGQAIIKAWHAVRGMGCVT